MTLTLRPATPADATHMAALVNLAGGGLPAAAWATKADYGQDPLEVGRADAQRDDGRLSWKNGQIAEIDGQVAGLLMDYVRADKPVEIDSGTHPLFRPLIKLANLAPGTRFISVLSTYPHFQRRGVGSALLRHSEGSVGPKGMALIVLNDSAAAMGFSMKMGYHEAARRPLVKADWRTDSTEWVLMRKD